MESIGQGLNQGQSGKGHAGRAGLGRHLRQAGGDQTRSDHGEHGDQQHRRHDHLCAVGQEA